MNYTIAWDNDDQTCILLTFESLITWDIIYAASDELCTMMQSVSHTVDWISDLRASPNMPGENASSHVQALFNQMPPNAGMNVVVTRQASLFTISLLTSLVRIIGWNRGFAMATSMDQARELIQQRHSRLAV
jgi:hypothetical protein